MSFERTLCHAAARLRPSTSVHSLVLPPRRGRRALLAVLCLAGGMLPASRIAAAEADASAPSSMPTNPLLSESPLPFHFPPFDQIKDDDFVPAFEAGMAEELKEVEAVAANPAAPTFANTLVALERSGRLLRRVDRVFFNLNSANTDPTLQQIEREMAPKLAAQQDAIRLNGPLFARIQTLYAERDRLQLDPESGRLVERYYKDFVRAGARLGEADKTRLKAINAELARLQTTFSQNVLKETNAAEVAVDDRAQLAGLSDAQVAAAAAAARKAGRPDGYALRLVNTTGQPALASLQDRALRERIQQVSEARCSHGGEYDNRAIVLRMVALRAERAALLGYPNHAAYVLEDQTAGTPAAVNKLLGELAPSAVANARGEAAAMQALIDTGSVGFALGAPDWSYYAEKLRRARYAYDGRELRPYLELNRVLRDGVFYAATRLYGITFRERHGLPVYEPDVRVLEVADADGTPLALLLADLYARPSKKGGAWMSSYVTQSRLLGTKPVVAIHLNVPKPPAGEPTLLTFEEVTTAFHEFGHALHGMFSQVEYPRFSGTQVPRDFVEFPSQVNEIWAAWPEVLQHYARHHRTGEPLPAALLEKLLAAQKFNQGFKTTEYLEASLIDQAWHQLAPGTVPADVPAFEAAVLRRTGVDFPPVPPRYHSTYFSHIFAGGYSAGYYSYIWAEVMDADAEAWFRRHGGLTRENGDRLRRTVLARGNSEEAMTQFRAFAGGDPDIRPLLERRGLDRAPPIAAD